MSTNKETEAEVIKNLENELGVPDGFFYKLRDEDDWSFVVKLQSLVEAAVTHLLEERFGEPCLGEVFSQLEISNNKTGKIAFLSALNLMDKHNLKYIKQLSELRNKLIHNISNIQFSIEEYINVMDKNQIKKLISSLFSSEDEGLFTGKLAEFKKLPKKQYKLLFWYAALEILMLIYIFKQKKELKDAKELALLEGINNVGGLRHLFLRGLADDVLSSSNK